MTAAEEIRARFDVPIIYLTAYADSETLRRAKIAEPYGYIVKPFREREVHIAIDIALYRHRVERQLREREEFFAATLRSIGDAVIATDTNGVITFMNAVAQTLTGWRQDDARGKMLADVLNLFSETTGRPVEQPIARVIRSGSNVDLSSDTKLVDRRDTSIPIDANAAPIKNDKGDVSGVIIVLRDVTERRALDERLRGQNRDLEEQYRQVKEASRLKSEFLANMSHELRTPLNGVIGLAQLMHGGVLGPVSSEHKECLGDVLANAHHLLHGIEGVLDFTQALSDRMEFLPARVDLPRLVSEVLDLLRDLAASKSISVSMNVAQIDDVVVDPRRLKQVLHNYVSNAVKFTPDGGRVIVRAAPDGANTFRLEVEDTGIGIDAENLGRLFVEFQQLDAGRGKKYPGVGMGLALTKRVVEAQGGRVGVRSTPGVGSTFFAVSPRIARAELLTADG